MTDNERPPKPTAPAPVDVRAIPALAWLADPMHRRWVGWKYEWEVNDKGEGKWTKVPYQLNDRKARNNTPATWVSYGEIWPAVVDRLFDGIGLMILGLPGEDFAAIDLDDIRDPKSGKLIDWARELVGASESYWGPDTKVHFMYARREQEWNLAQDWR